DWLARNGLEQPGPAPAFSQRATDPFIHLPTPEPGPSLVSRAPASAPLTETPELPPPSHGKLWLILLLLVLAAAGGAAAFLFPTSNSPPTSQSPPEKKGYRNEINQ